ncbi:ubiquitin related modifier 1 [Biscogniauxia mediterranea]|nr:ubiquitin related modifier 1 [Biscogniauxia mediterranea]
MASIDTAPPKAGGDPTTPDIPNISIEVEFSGGLEMLFSSQRRHSLSLPATHQGTPITIAYLINHLCNHTMKDTRKELFILDNHLRPGILVLINDADWELEGEEAYELQSGDNILFVSTLHGG